MKKRNLSINKFRFSETKEEDKDSSFLCETNPSNIFLNKTQERVGEINSLIDTIRQKSPISIWDLAKKTNISHSKLYYILRDLEFSGVLYSKIKLNENNRSVRMIYIKQNG